MVDDEDRHAWERPGTFEVADGIHRIPLPLPGDGLRAVNVYAIVQPDGVVLIDSGWAIAGAREQLEAGLAAIDRDLGMVQRVLVTHVHRDHYELGVQLQQVFGTHLALGIGEQPSLETLLDEDHTRHSAMTRRLLAGGAAPLVERLEEWHRRRGSNEAPDLEWSLPDEWLTDAQQVALADRTLTVIATPGHTQGHVVFVDHDAGRLFSGDHVLPHITPSIGFEQLPVESSLADYLASLSMIRALPDLAMLPAHGPVRPTTHDRIDELLVHHDDRLKATHGAVLDGHATGYEVARALPWTRRGRAFDDLDAFNQMLAVNETVAHLDVLVRREELAVDEVGEGSAPPVRRYRA